MLVICADEKMWSNCENMNSELICFSLNLITCPLFTLSKLADNFIGRVIRLGGSVKQKRLTDRLLVGLTDWSEDSNRLQKEMTGRHWAAIYESLKQTGKEINMDRVI